MNLRTIVLYFFLTIFISSCVSPEEKQPLAWPEITQVNKPWTRWWWMGSSVDEANLSRSLELYEQAGIGGVEITPIYGVKGKEDQFIEYLSSDWVDRLGFTLEEAGRLNLGVDMATGTGWPFGGPHVEAEDASRYIAHKVYLLQGGERLNETVQFTQQPILRTVNSRPDINDLVEPIRDNDDLQVLSLDQVRFSRPLPLHVLMAYSDNGEVQELTDLVDEEGWLDWTAPEGNWTLYALFMGWHGKMVERAAPGGEGYAINHFSETALQNYLAPFNDAFEGRNLSALRGFFNDSYEVDDANGEADWTPAFLDEFNARRGYDLRSHLPALFGEDSDDANARVLTDYRQTISELILERFTEPWTHWANEKGKITRNQSHGSPASILDLYAASDIPETESTEMMRIKFASSAAHVSGKPLASAEAATWLDEHFLSNWADVKEAVDWFFLGGVNHIVYHGTSYSPEDAEWPGWLFYAAVHFSPQNPMWRDFDALNTYVARSQSILQAGVPDNDVLLYLPLMDRFAQRDPSLLVHFHGLEPFEGMPVAEQAAWLFDHGYAFDFISDSQLLAADFSSSSLIAGGARYQTIVVPAAQFMPESTLVKLVSLAEMGATILFVDELPADVPGMGNLEERRATFVNATGTLQFADTAVQEVQRATVGSGRVLVGPDLEAMLHQAEVWRESLVDENLEFIRRSRTDGTDYFLVNRGAERIDDWIDLRTTDLTIALMDPMSGEMGMGATRNANGVNTQVYVQIPPGETLILRTYKSHVEAEPYPYFSPAAAPIALDNPWQIEFLAGGPVLPEWRELTALSSWTNMQGEPMTEFAGTARYIQAFTGPDTGAAFYRLDLGEVYETARVRLNGMEIGTLIGPNYTIDVQADMLQESNLLEVEVSSSMTNRIIALDREGGAWKKFYNINVSARYAENRNAQLVFDASDWEPAASGLLGPVTLTPLEHITP